MLNPKKTKRIIEFASIIFHFFEFQAECKQSCVAKIVFCLFMFYQDLITYCSSCLFIFLTKIRKEIVWRKPTSIVKLTQFFHSIFDVRTFTVLHWVFLIGICFNHVSYVYIFIISLFLTVPAAYNSASSTYWYFPAIHTIHCLLFERIILRTRFLSNK